jgi:hypothetical protein
MKEKVWTKAVFWAMDHPHTYNSLEDCCQLADTISTEYSARFGEDVSNDSQIPGFSLEFPPSFEDLLNGCIFDGGNMMLDNMEDENNVLEYTRAGCQDYAFHMISGNLGILKAWYELNQQDFLSDITESIKANDEL